MTDLFSQILNMSLTGSVVILAVLAARLALGKAPKIYSYALWAVVLFRLLCPVSLTVPSAPMALLQPQVTQSQGISTMTYVPVEYVHRTVEPQNAQPIPEEVFAQTVPEVSLFDIVAGIWAAGAAVLLLRGIIQYFCLRRRLRNAVFYRGDTWLSERISMPFALGIFRPRVYLPASLPKQERRYITAHERHHIRRGDPLIKLLAYGALCLHWFNPLVWLAFCLAGKDMEMSCDEAVIRKLPKSARADYCAALLRLSTGRPSPVSLPLAFGEGDPRSRIRNIARWRGTKLWVSALCAILCLVILTACALNPAAGENTALQETDQSHIPESTPLFEASQGNVEETAVISIPYRDQFESTDGSVSFTLDVTQPHTNGSWPSVEVVPDYLTGEKVRQVAQAIFGEDAVFYESVPTFAEDRRLSGSEIQTLLDRYAPYTDPKKLQQELFPGGQGGPEEDYYQEMAARIEDFLETYTAKLETAPREVPRELCRWEFQNFAYYNREPDDPEFELWHDDAISAQVTVDGIPYTFLARTMDGVIKENYITCYIHDLDDPGYSLGDAIFQSRLYSTEEPGQGQLADIQEKAYTMLNQMGLGRWQVDKCQVEIFSLEGQDRYTVAVQAVPVLSDTPVLFEEDKGIFNPNDINYAYTRAKLRFANDGTLLHMELESPIQITRTITEETALLSWEQLMEEAKAVFQRQTANSYMPYIFPEPLENLTAQVTITEAQMGLSRIKVEGEEETYRYIPSVTFRGSAVCTDQNGFDYTNGNELTEFFTVTALDAEQTGR